MEEEKSLSRKQMVVIAFIAIVLVVVGIIIMVRPIEEMSASFFQDIEKSLEEYPKELQE